MHMPPIIILYQKKGKNKNTQTPVYEQTANETLADFVQ